MESILPPRLRELFDIPTALVSVVTFASVVATLGMSSLITLLQVRKNRLRLHRGTRRESETIALGEQ